MLTQVTAGPFRPGTAVFLTATILAAGGCRRAPDGWTPVLESTSTSYLETEMGRTLDRVSAARRSVRSDPGDAVELLGSAERELALIEDTLLEVGDRVEGSLLLELEQIGAQVTDARIELHAESPGVTAALRQLAGELERVVAKAGVYL